jgi:hypothetical protein
VPCLNARLEWQKFLLLFSKRRIFFLRFFGGTERRRCAGLRAGEERVFQKRRRSGGICIPPDLPPITERDGSAWHPSRAGLVGGPKLGFLDTALLAVRAKLHVVLEAGAFLGEKARYLTVGKIIRQVVAAG